MAKETIIKCDQCGEVIPAPFRGAFRGYHGKNYKDDATGVTLFSLDDRLHMIASSTLFDDADLCGLNCASKWVNAKAATLVGQEGEKNVSAE